MKRSFLVLWAGCCCLPTMLVVQGRLLQLHIITRHGSRYPLIKDADTLLEASPGHLTTQGFQELVNLGQFLNATYGSLLVDNDNNNNGINKARFESSALDRTMESAMALGQGLYGKSLPVYTVKNDNDVTIRPYDKCPTFVNDLQSLYDSDQWTNVELDNIFLLNRLAKIPAFQQYASQTDNYVHLQDLWNIYDLLVVAKQQCTNDDTNNEDDDNDTTCPPYLKAAHKSGLEEFEEQQIHNLAQFAEIRKYQTGGSRLGSNLLRHILLRMNTNAFHKEQVYVYSGHYPTLIGLLNSMGSLTVIQDEIPPFASAVVLEVVEENMVFYVKVWYKSGDSMTAVRLCEGNCTLQEFIELVDQRLHHTVDWCNECRNNEADQCLKQTVVELLQRESSCSSRTEYESLWMLLVGSVVTLLCVALVQWVVCKRQKCVIASKIESQPDTTDSEMELTESSIT